MNLQKRVNELHAKLGKIEDELDALSWSASDGNTGLGLRYEALGQLLCVSAGGSVRMRLSPEETKALINMLDNFRALLGEDK